MNRLPQNLPLHAGLFVAVLSIIALMVGLWVWPPPKMPVYQGKTLSEWIFQLDQAADLHPADFGKVDAAQSAIRAIGTNALPFALADLRARETVFTRARRWLALRAPFLKISPNRAADKWTLGVQILDILGPIAKPALPELIAQATNHPGYSEEALLAVGAASLPAFTNLLRAQPSCALIRLLEQKVSLGQLSPEDAATALPCLIEISHSNDRLLAGAADETIGEIRREKTLSRRELHPP